MALNKESPNTTRLKKSILVGRTNARNKSVVGLVNSVLSLTFPGSFCKRRAFAASKTGAYVSFMNRKQRVVLMPDLKG